MGHGKVKMGVKAAVCAALLWLCLAAPAAYAGPMEDGQSAYEQKDYATALRLWRPLAEQGDAGMQALVGSMYHYGEGIPQDYAQAAAWYRKAADQGFAMAQVNLGVLYALGLGVREDKA